MLILSLLAPLLEIQDLDRAGDEARARSEALPAREELPRLAEKRRLLDVDLATAKTEQATAEAEEEALGKEVAEHAKTIEKAEVDRYSGKRVDRDDARAHDEAQQILRDEKDALETREMEMLEKIESIEARISEIESATQANQSSAEEVTASIQSVEQETEAELSRLAESRSKLEPGLPKKVVEAYDRVRAQPRAVGRGAAPLANGHCGGCRIKLPSLEVRKMLAEPDDAVIQCPQCRRVLVR